MGAREREREREPKRNQDYVFLCSLLPASGMEDLQRRPRSANRGTTSNSAPSMSSFMSTTDDAGSEPQQQRPKGHTSALGIGPSRNLRPNARFPEVEHLFCLKPRPLQPQKFCRITYHNLKDLTSSTLSPAPCNHTLDTKPSTLKNLFLLHLKL